MPKIFGFYFLTISDNEIVSAVPLGAAVENFLKIAYFEDLHGIVTIFTHNSELLGGPGPLLWVRVLDFFV